MKAVIGHERTLNMRSMSVTLVVTKLNGWLKADVACRVERESIRFEARRAGRDRGERKWGGGASGAHGEG